MKALRRVLKYVSATSNFKITGIYSPRKDIFKYYSDSDHAGDMPITTHSHTGTIATINDVPIFWRSKKQPKTSRSSAEAEIYALSETLADIRLLQWRMNDIGIEVPNMIDIQVDNNQAKVFAGNTCVNSRLRNAFSLKEKWVEELRDQSKVKVTQIAASHNMSDFLTKPQSGKMVKKCLNMINPFQVSSRQVKKEDAKDKDKEEVKKVQIQSLDMEE